ncbi:MAG: hypothetical protein HY424_02035 [Candidatus Levybacteria bacterium]|nr:hypothetical protein [Candidatus Levybacteria bacterium]
MPANEVLRHLEDTPITPEFLKADNNSEEAKELSSAWKENHNRGSLWGIVTCGDARIITPCPDNIISVRSIATAGTKDKEIFGSEHVQFTVVMSHVDGDTIKKGEKPKGCGGLGAKEEALNGNHENRVEGIQYYIDKNIEHPDPVIQALITAREIRNSTRKPALAVIQNHRTGKIFPFAVFLHGYQTVASELDILNLEKEYDPSKIYANEIPTLPTDAIPDIFSGFLETNVLQVDELLRKYPNLTEIQRVQNPEMVVVSSKLPSVRVRYPKTTNYPGRIFKLFLSREKEKTTRKIDITPVAQNEIMNQIQYPLGYAVKNYGQPNQPFSRTKRVLIETSDIGVSKKLATELAEKEWMKEWLVLPDHRIIVAQNIEGVSNIIDYFDPANPKS